MPEHDVHDDSTTTSPALAPPTSSAPRRGSDWTISIDVGVMQLAGLTSIGAGAIHAGAAGMHAEHPTLARLFVAVAVAQLAAGLVALVKGGRLAAVAAAGVNLGAVAAWMVTRFWGISWIDGLAEAEAAQLTDSTSATLGSIAVAAAAVALARRRTAVSAVRLGLPAFSVGAVTVIAMLAGIDHVHTHADAQTEVAGPAGVTGGANAAAVVAEPASDGHDHDHGDAAVAGGATAAPSNWPRPWDPAHTIDLSGVEGVSPEQQARAESLLQRTLEELPAFADVETIRLLGYKSIGDAATGFEHYIRYDLINDDVWLDPTQPESLVFAVDGEERTLVSAMFIAPAMDVADPRLTEYGGPLMTWHVHDNLCWRGSADGPKVAGLTDANGNCPEGAVKAGGENPMVHVWIAPHECGPFAALEGAGAGKAAGSEARTDQCAHDHGDQHDHAAGEVVALQDPASGAETAPAPAPVPYDPELPIDLSGMPGVTPQQQAFAENLVANTLVNLPQWADAATAEAAGFRSIRDGATGHEHYIQWDWINDDVWLDPDYPESLVYEILPDGSRKLVSAMYMLPETMTLEDVPDWGGPLMQWHIHDDLCFDVSDPEAPRVAGLTDAAGECTAPLVRLGEAPMIHVWITPHECGPFAALEGVGAGQILEGEERLCDHAHGSHD